MWAGELEGWLTAQPQWHLVADAATAAEWEPLLREVPGEPVQIMEPLPAAELAASTARRRRRQTNARPFCLRNFPTRYRQQFVDRLWLHGLVAALVLYLAIVVVYFCATGVVGYQTGKIEAQAAAMSGSYTNALQFKARYDVLKERQDLKFAALDSWKLVAEQLPDGISLERFSFARRPKVSLNGTCHAGSNRPHHRFSVMRCTRPNSTDSRCLIPRRRPVQWRQSGNTGELGISAFCWRTRIGGFAVKKYFSQLRPLERRLAVGVLVVLFLVLNYVFVWPHFSDFGKLRQRGDIAHQKLELYQTGIAQAATYAAKVKKCKSG